MDMLAAYLGATRIGRSDVSKDETLLLYRPLVELMRDTIRGTERERCEVVLVYTLNRFTEITRLGGRTLLIYDRYAGQALNTFTRILTWSTGPEASARAFARIFAEQAIIAGDGAGAFAGAETFARLGEHWNLPPASSDLTVSLQVHLQEMFVFAHEYCHLIMTGDDGFRESRKHVGDILIEGYLEDDSEEAYRSFEARYPGYQTMDKWRSTRRVHRAFIDEHRDEIREELACDDFALNILVRSCLDRDIDVGLAFKSAFLALRNIRALAYIRRLSNPRLAKLGLAGARPERLLQVRQHLLRNGFVLAAKVHDVEQALHSISGELMDLSDLHDRQVDFPLLTRIVPELQKLRKFMLKKGVEADMHHARKAARALGWDPDAEEIDYAIL
jgi:hypothetical protein